MTEPSPLGRAAEEYAAAGWYVFPLKPRDKTPMTERGFKNASNKPEIVRQWWAKTPNANIGLDCGRSGFVVIDLDKRADADGLVEWEHFTSQHKLAPRTATSLTGGGGRHLLFKTLEGVKIKNSASRLAPGIDVRADGGYIVLPPSIHPSGKPYAWENDDTEVEPIPDVVVQILTTEPDPWQIFTLRDAWQPRPPLVWIVDRVLSESSLSIWYGAPGSLKSMVLADMAVCVAGGKPWLADKQGMNGYKTTRGGVLWCDFDNGQRRTHERFQAISKAHGVARDVPLYYVSMPDPFLDAGDTAAIGALAQRIVDREISVVIIDNLGVISGEAEENTADMVRPMRGLRWLSDTTRAAVCVLHHQRKTNGFTSRAGESLRGHSSIEAAIDSAILVARDDLNVTMESTKDRGMRVQPFGAEFSYANDNYHELIEARFWPADPITEENEEKGRRAEIETAALDYIRKFPNVTATQVYNEIGGNKKMVFDVLRQLRLDGKLLEKQGGGMSRLLYLP